MFYAAALLTFKGGRGGLLIHRGGVGGLDVGQVAIALIKGQVELIGDLLGEARHVGVGDDGDESNEVHADVADGVAARLVALLEHPGLVLLQVLVAQAGDGHDVLEAVLDARVFQGSHIGGQLLVHLVYIDRYIDRGIYIYACRLR